MANRNYPRAETALDALAAKALDAERAGEISGTEADRIVAAASDLLAQLRLGGDVDAPEGSLSPAPVEPSPPDDSFEGDDDDGEDEDED